MNKKINLLGLLFVMGLGSCKEQELKITTDSKPLIKEAHFLTPQETKPPEEILLSSRPNPKVIEIPSKPGKSEILKINDVDTSINLAPPPIAPLGLYYIMQHYGSEQGLPIDAVTAGVKDKSGNLWFGTQGGGLTRFDGNSFINYTEASGLSNNSVETIFIDSQGNFWIGTLEAELSKYDGKQFITWNKNSGLSGKTVKTILEDEKGHFWFGTNLGIIFFDGNTFTTYSTENTKGLNSNKIQSSIIDSKGDLWFGTNGGITRFNGETFITLTTKDGLINNNVFSVFEDREGFLWFGTAGGLSQFDGHFFKNYTMKDGLVGNVINTIYHDQSKTIWIGTDRGLSEFNGKTFVNYTTDKGLSNDDVRVIIEDNVGNLWIGTNGGGLNRFDKKSFTSFSHKDGYMSKMIRTILEDKKGNLWFGTQGKGLYLYDGSSIKIFTPEQGLSSENIQDLLEDENGDIWIATYGGGVNKYDGKSFTIFTAEQGLAGNTLRSILKDSKGNFWFGTTNGLSKYDGKTFTNYRKAQGLPHDYTRVLLEDKIGNIWIGTFGGGVSLFDGEKFTNFSVKDGLANDFIFTILEDSGGNIWFGTFGGGASRYDGKTFLNFTTEQGLPDNVVYILALNKEKNITFGTNEGFSILDGFALRSTPNKVVVLSQNNLSNEELENYVSVFEVFSPKRGFPVRDTNGSPNSMYLDKRGILWIGTGAEKTNVVQFDYSKLTKTSEPPNVQIKEVQIDNMNVIWGLLKESEASTILVEESTDYGKILSPSQKQAQKDKFSDISYDDLSRFYYIPQNLVLPHKHNNITFNFAAIEPAQPQNVIYQYKLEGFDKDWSPPSNNTKATFGNIYEGNYTFKVKAQSPYGVWSEPISYSFRVLPPWYRTWWAYLLYAFSTALSIYSFVRWRTAKLRRQYERAERFVPKRVLELLNKKHMEDVELGDSVKLKITAMFADIRGFTTLSETLSPEQTAFFLNTYTYYMAPAIRKNNGFINQFLGDGILALFPDKAEESVDAALSMVETLPNFNRDIVSKGFTAISLGIGLNAGDAMLFALGEKERLDASIVSDAINTAARVEGLNKYYKTQVLISDTVYQQLPDYDKYLIRLVDKVYLKGKNVSTRIYEVKSKQNTTTQDHNYIELYHKGFAFYEKGDFSSAESIFQTCQEHQPEDGVVKLLLTRSSNFKNSPVPVDWDGTIRLSEK